MEERADSLSPVQVDMAGRIREAAARLSLLTGLKKKVGIIRMWPDQAVAEHENVERLKTAFEFLGVSVIELDRYGCILNSPNQKITSNDVDFVLHLHFETGKTYDVVSVAAMWNPSQFYYDWGFSKFWSNQMSHDVFAITGNTEIMGMVRASKGSLKPEEVALFNHTLADPIYLPSEKSKYKAFYCGINWEKITGKKGRHDEILKALDAQDLIDIYGPETLQGKKVWDGFSSYRGPLPFDGKKVISKIWGAGACLVFSSDAHIHSGIMSNRLFEALAAGAIVIGDEHPFIKAAIGDNYICVPSWLPQEKRVEIIAEALRGFDEDPVAAKNMASAAQHFFLQKFFLCDQLVGIYESVSHFRNRTALALSRLNNPVVDLVVQPLDNSAERIIANIRTLKSDLGDKARIFLLVDDGQQEWFNSTLADLAIVIPTRGTKKQILRPYECLELIAHEAKAEKVCFLYGIETVHADAFLQACGSLKGVTVARLGHVIMHFEANNNAHYEYRSCSTPLEETFDAVVASVIFDRSWLDRSIASKWLNWKDLCKISEHQTDNIYECPSVGWSINLKSYEMALSRGYNFTPVSEYVVKIMDHSFDAVEGLENNIVRRRRRDKIIYKDLAAEKIVKEIKSLSEIDKWGLTLDLYKSVPLPKWFRGLITNFRKAAGIR